MTRNRYFLERLIIIFLGFAPFYILLSVSYETLFYCGLFMCLFFLLSIENNLHNSTRKNIILLDLYRAALFMIFIQVSFFGTGNIASLSSFSLDSVYRFITVFQPFIMATLLVMKILVPFVLLISAFTMLNQMIGLLPGSLFMLVVSTSDIITIEFLFRVVNIGSWLDIGVSISRFIICSVFIVFEIGLIVVCRIFVKSVSFKKSSKAE